MIWNNILNFNKMMMMMIMPKIIENEVENEESLEVVKLLLNLMFMCIPGPVQGNAAQL